MFVEQKDGSHRVVCDCCKKETLAVLRKDSLMIMDRRHGKKHFVVITFNEMLDKVNSTGYDGGITKT